MKTEFGSFGSLADLKRHINLLDIAEEREVLIREKDSKEEPIEADRYKAIWNKNKGKLSCVSSDKYKMVQHNEVFNPIVDALLDVGIKCTGRIREFHEGDVAIMELRFEDPKYKIKDDSKEGVQMGIRITSGYNLWTAIKFELWAFRLICTNGMRLWKVVEGIGTKRNHIGQIDIPQMARMFIKQVAQHSPQLQKLIDEAILDTTEWKIAEKLFEVMIKTDKYRAILMAEIRKLDKDTVTRYDLYNILTRLASDSKRSLRESAEDYLQAKAQEVLTQPLEVLENKYIVKKKKLKATAE